MLVSGGVDSSVCAALCREAVGPDRVHALHIDHGFMRHGAPPTAQTTCRECSGQNISETVLVKRFLESALVK